MNNTITILHRNLPAYGSMVLLAIFLVSILGLLVTVHRKLSLEAYLRMGLAGLLAAFLGSKLWSTLVDVLIHGEKINSIESFLDHGSSFYGGLFLGLLAVFLKSFLLEVDFFDYVRKLIFLVPFFHGIWKMGCFLGGCCYGIPYAGAGSVIYQEGAAAPVGIALFPVQLMEALFLFAMAICFYLKGRKNIWEHPMLEYMGAYSVIRFFVEFFRHHDHRWILSLAQLVSLCCFMSVVLIFIIKKKCIHH